MWSQEYGDKDFYLLDSLDLSTISAYDKAIIDSSLLIYHNTLEDSVQLEMLEYIVDNCWDPMVWPRYNNFLIDLIKSKLVFNKSDKEETMYMHYLAGAISNKGFLHDQRGEFMDALDYYHQSLQLYEKIDDKEGIGTSFNNLGVLYSMIGDTIKAFEYHELSLKTKLEIKDMHGVAMSYNNIGTLYENRNQQFIALEYYERSLEIYEDLDDPRGIAISYDNIGNIYFMEEVYGKALHYYLQSLKIWQNLEIESGISGSYNSLARCHLEMGSTEMAIKYGMDSYKLAKEIGFPVNIENSSKTLMTIYKRVGDFEMALKYSEEYIAIRERIRSSDNSRGALKKSMQYEYQKMALRDSLEHEKQKEIRDVEIARQKTQSYALYAGIGLLSILFVVGYRSYQRKKKDNHEINEQKAEIENQHVALAKTHKEISDSISYAKRIQEAILPSHESFKKYLPDAFIYYRPKDVVSGDFYWLVEKGDYLFVAAADCTGHGVPGAMVSVICSNALNRVVREFNLTRPGEILNKTREIVKEAFDAEHIEVKDGMDISLLSINKLNNEIYWAGAYNPLFIVKSSDGSLIEYTPNKQPVGKFHVESEFTDQPVQVEKGDIAYLFSDGYVDQFGGPHGKKYKYDPFKKFLIDISSNPTNEQASMLDKEFDRWRGKLEQIDDVCVLGVRF